MLNMGLVRVNIHYKGKIPWLNIQGPRYNIGLSPSIYKLLKEDPRVSIYPIDNDPIMKAKKAATVAPKVEPVEVIKEVIEEEVLVEGEVVIDEEILEETVEEYVEPNLDDIEVTDEDLAIEAALDDYDEEIEDEVSILPELIEKAATHAEYTKAELEVMTKADMKSILNNDRGFEPATDFYGRYHDNHDVLLQKVLDSQ